MSFGGKSKSGFGGKSKKSSGGFGGKSKGGYGGGKKKKANIKSIGAIFEGKHGPWIKMNDYHVEVILKEKETGKFFKPAQLRLGQPFKEVEGLVYEISVNFDNDNAVEFLGSDDEE